MPDDKTSPEGVDALTEAVTGLAGKVTGLSGKVDALGQYGHRNRRMIWGLVISFVLDLMLTIPVAWAVVRANDASDLSKANHTNQVATCLAGNDTRADARALWDKFFELAGPPRNDEVAKKITELKTFVAKTYADRDCSKI